MERPKLYTLKASLLIYTKDHSKISLNSVSQVLAENKFHYCSKKEKNMTMGKNNCVVLRIPISLINKAYMILKKSFDIRVRSEALTTIYIDVDSKETLKTMKSEANYSYYSNKRNNLGFQCLFSTRESIAQFVQNYLDGKFSQYDIKNIYPFMILKDKNPKNPFDDNTPIPDPLLKEFIQRVSNSETESASALPTDTIDQLVLQELDQYHVSGDLRECFLLIASEIFQETKDVPTNIIKEIISKISDDPLAYEIFIECIENPEEKSYEQICNDYYQYIREDNNDQQSLHSTVSSTSTIEVMTEQTPNVGKLKFSSYAEINAYGFQYKIGNTAFDDPNLHTFLQWFDEGYNNEIVLINFIINTKYNRVCLTYNKKILFITSSNQEKNEANNQFATFLVKHKLLYSRKKDLKFISDILHIDLKQVKSYDYLDLCFKQFNIDVAEEFYLQIPKITHSGCKSNSKTPEKSHIFAFASSYIYTYESFLRAMQRHVYAEEVYNAYTNYQYWLKKDKENSPEENDDNDDDDQ